MIMNLGKYLLRVLCVFYDWSDKLYTISVNKIVKAFDDNLVLKGVTSKFNSGKIYAIAGSNGCGKSTLMRILTEVIKPTDGKVEYYGQTIEDKKPSEFIAYQPQNISNLFRGLKVWEAIYYTAILRKMNKSDAKRETDELIRYFKIEDIRDEALVYLSGGEKQLTSICMTFIGSLPIMFFDEPTNNLDPERKRIFADKLFQLREEETLSIIITHDLTELEDIIDHLVILKDGKIILDEEVCDFLPEMDDDVNILIPNYLEIEKKILSKIKAENNCSIRNDNLYLNMSKDSLSGFLNEYRNKYIDKFSIEISSVSLQDKYLITNGGEKIGMDK